MGLETGACLCHFARRYLERNPQLPLSLRQIDPLIRQLSLSLLTSNRPEQYNWHDMSSTTGMTSFAGIKSWNLCGRRGVNSATALRISLGSKLDIGWNWFDVNWEV